MKKNWQILFFIFLSFKLFSSQKTEYWINIFVHGSIGLNENFNLKTFRRLVRDQMDNSDYERNVRVIRNDPKSFQFQPMQEMGLREIRPNIKNPKGPYLFAKVFDRILKKFNKHSKNKYYTFGWSGLISYKKRLAEARVFYQELRKELQRLNNKGYTPKIRLIGYSHGATLAFNFAQLRDQEFKKDKFEIDELISIGMPILQSTIDKSKHKIFKKIYNFFSRKDTVQTLDVFSPCSIVSQRVFPNLDSKIYQIEIKISEPNKFYYNGRWQTKFKDFSPNHYDLWYFGNYQEKNHLQSSLYPIPVAVFIPYFLYFFNNFDQDSHNLIVNLLPSRNKEVFHKKFAKNIEINLHPKELAKLKNVINRFYAKN